METREELEAALVEAEAELARAVAERARSYPDTTEADAHLDRVRAHCRHVRTALEHLDRTQEVAPPAEFREKPASPPKMPPPAGRAGRARAIERLLRALPRSLAAARSAPDWRSLARQGVMLVALILAYLQYYFLDVQLQVARLPSVFG